MKKIILLTTAIMLFAAHGISAKETAAQKPGNAEIVIYNNSPQYIKVRFHVGKNKTQCFYKNRQVESKGFFKGWTVKGKKGCEIPPGTKMRLFARWGTKDAGPTTYETMVAGIPKGIIFETEPKINKKKGKEYYLSHRDKNGNKVLASLFRNVEIRPEKEAGGYLEDGLKERWYSIWDNGSWNTIPELKKKDLLDY